ncbi:MAG: PAS domain S-box protein [Bacteroidia bacterium]|nr:PAS domain S-box protein [Bacteroidia bacterium]
MKENFTPPLILRWYLLLAGVGVVFFAWLQAMIDPSVDIRWPVTWVASALCIIPLIGSFVGWDRYSGWASLISWHMILFSVFAQVVAAIADYPWLMGFNGVLIYQLVYLGLFSLRYVKIHTLVGIATTVCLMLIPHSLELQERISVVGLMGLIGFVNYLKKSHDFRVHAQTLSLKAAVERSAQMLNAVLQSSSDEIFALDTQFTVLSINENCRQAFRDVHGRSLQVGDNVLQIMKEQGRTLLMYDQYLRGMKGEAQNFTILLPYPSGPSWREVAIFPVYEAHEVIGISIFIHNIDKRWEMEQRLARSEARLSAAVSGGQLGVWDISLETGEVYYSDKLRELLGYTLEEFPDTREALVSRIHPDDLEAALEVFKAHVKGSLPLAHAEFRMRHRNGTWRWVLSQGMALRNEAGWTLRITGVIKDISERKETELMLKGVMDSSVAGIWVVSVVPDAAGGPGQLLVKSVNEKVQRETGLPLNQLLGRPLSEVLQPYDEQFIGYVYDVLTHQQPVFTEFHTRMDKQPDKWYDLSFYLLDDKHVVINCYDITARKVAEKQLRTNEYLLRTIINNTPDWIFVKDLNHRYILVNQSFAASYGRQPEDLIGKHELDLGIAPALVMGDTAAGIRGFWADDDEVIRTRQPQLVPEEATVSRGEPIVLSTVKVPLSDPQGNLWGLLGFAHDITKHKKTELELQKLSLVASRTNSGVVITDREGRIEWVNTAFCAMTGYELSEIQGKKPGSFLHGPDTSPDTVRLIREKLTQLEPFSIDILNYRKDRSSYWVNMNIAPVLDAKGQAERFIAIETDTSLQKEVEQNLIKAKQAAEEASRLKADFLSTMSHEIRTPMNAVIGMTGLLMQTALSQEQREYVETIRFSGDNLLTVINDILDFSKIEAGKMELEAQPFQLVEMAEDVTDLLSPLAIQKNLELMTDIAPDVPRTILGDPTRIGQILVNLLNNALKFTQQGEVVLTVSLASRTGNTAVISYAVRDTGIGIPEDKLDRLFKAFSQVDASMTRRFGGTGLGLIITRQLVDLMGGTLHVTSTEGEGSVFTANIPCQIPPENDNTREVIYPHLQGRKVLIIENNPTHLAVRSRELTDLGIVSVPLLAPADIHTVLAQLEGISLVLVKLEMKPVSGCELAVSIRKDFPHVSVILMVAKGKLQHEVCARYQIWQIPRPIHRQALLNMILEAIPDHEQRPSAIVAVPVAERPFFGNLSVLVAEDNAINQKVALRMLEKLGIQADVAANGLEALKAIHIKSYDVIFMDMQMPEMDGLEATQAIRAAENATHRHVIIAMTANAMSGDRERCLAAGMDDYISKPVNLERVQEALARWFGETSAAAG